MSMPPEPPKRIAEILLEILALSKQSESARGTDPSELSHVNCVEEQSQQKDEQDNNPQSP